VKISYRNKRLRKLIEQYTEAKGRFGDQNARKIIQRMNELQAAPTLDDMPPAARPHPLTGDRKGQYAVDLKHPSRLLFEPVDPEDPHDRRTIKAICIIEITDYH